MSDSRPSNGLTRCVVTPDHDGARIDIFMAAATALSRRSARRLLSDGMVWLNGRPIRVQSRTVTTGDILDVLRPAEDLGVSPLPDIEGPTILHEDSWLLVAAKPAGVLSAMAENMLPGELAFDQRVLLAKAVADGKRPYLRLVHRLDRTTSGAILFATHSEALPRLTAAWAGARVERLYIAVVEGLPEFDRVVVDRAIGRDRSHTWRFTTDETGKPATTDMQTISRLENGLAVVQCRLITGRTHQVRVHLASIGHPVLGDRLYGSTRADEAPRPLLHAASIRLPHPKTGKELRVVCPPPEDLAGFLTGDPPG